MNAPAHEARAAGRRDRSIRALGILVLTCSAVGEPLLGLAGRFPQLLAAHEARPADLVALALGLCFLLPAGLLLIEWLLARVAPSAGRLFHLLLVVVLAAATLLKVLREIDAVPGTVWVAVSLLLGLGMAEIYDRFAAVRSALALLAPAPAVVAGLFLFASPARQLVFPEPYVPSGDARPAADVPVVLVIFDELSLPTLTDGTGAVDAARFPHFAELARRATWFRNATTTAEYTPFALPAILTGRYLGGEGPPSYLASATVYPRNLFTLLGGGYDLSVSETLTSLCPRELCRRPAEAGAAGRLGFLLLDLAAVYPQTVLPADVTNELPEATRQWRDFVRFDVRRKKAAWAVADRKPQVFDEFVAGLSGGGDRTLHFLHCDLPHVPWQYLPGGTRYGGRGSDMVAIEGLAREVWDSDPWPVHQGLQRYLLQLAYTDRLLGRLLAALDQTGLFDRALVIVTADHGVSFLPGEERRRATPATARDVLSVPLFVKLPHQSAGAVDDRNAESIDVLPTIVDVLGLAEPWPMDGASLAAASAPERPAKRVFGKPHETPWLTTYDPALFHGPAAAPALIRELFGPADEALSLFRLGPDGHLVGRPLAGLDVAPAGDATARLHHPELYDGVDPASGFLPARVTGEVVSPRLRRGPLRLAIAIGDTVWAATRTTGRRGRGRFSAMVPARAFTPGENRVRVFVVEGSGEQTRLVAARPSSGTG